MPAATPLSPPDASRCPLCGDDNRCAMEVERATGAPQPPCWCTQVDFSDALLARIPAQARGLACICARCAAQSPTSGVNPGPTAL